MVCCAVRHTAHCELKVKGHTHTPSLISAREPRACGRSPRSSRPQVRPRRCLPKRRKGRRPKGMWAFLTLGQVNVTCHVKYLHCLVPLHILCLEFRRRGCFGPTPQGRRIPDTILDASCEIRFFFLIRLSNILV